MIDYRRLLFRWLATAPLVVSLFTNGSVVRIHTLTGLFMHSAYAPSDIAATRPPPPPPPPPPPTTTTTTVEKCSLPNDTLRGL